MTSFLRFHSWFRNVDSGFEMEVKVEVEGEGEVTIQDSEMPRCLLKGCEDGEEE
jgi:hypothetical protein